MSKRVDEEQNHISCSPPVKAVDARRTSITEWSANGTMTLAVSMASAKIESRPFLRANKSPETLSKKLQSVRNKHCKEVTISQK